MSDAHGTPSSGHAHGPGFQRLVNEARAHVRTMSIEEYVRRRDAGEAFVLVDTREEHEWGAGHLPGAIHLSKGVIERDIERTVPDRAASIVAYCGGGYRSVLVCENLQRMGYVNCISLDGGWRGWNRLSLPVVKPDAT